MDLAKEVEVVLRDAGFETWPWGDGLGPVICFEDETVLGFVHVFTSIQSLLSGWESAEDKALARFNPALRKAGEKAWNVYSIFLSEEDPSSMSFEKINRIEENFRQTRKIAKGGISSTESVRNALLPLLPISSLSVIDSVSFEDRLQSSLQEIHADGAKAFLKGIIPLDVVNILVDDK